MVNYIGYGCTKVGEEIRCEEMRTFEYWSHAEEWRDEVVATSYYWREVKDEASSFDTALKNRTMSKVYVNDEQDEMIFERVDGRVFKFYHDQDCCESVDINDITGDLDDLVGTPLLVVEESTNCDSGEEDSYESRTWTFYKFATIKGWVDVRWLGESNGYYSESVDFKRVK